MPLIFSFFFHIQREKKVGAAQEKQKAECESRKKGVKVHITVGMKVLKKNVHNESCKGGKMETKWTGPYK